MSDAGSGWGRRRLLLALTAVALVAVVLVVGLVLALHSNVVASTPARPAATHPNAPDGNPPLSRDEIAAQPMMAVSPQDARPGLPAATVGPRIVVPASTRTGPAEVPTGFPRTPEGAVGQLSAIETTVLQGMSITQTHDIYAGWALPGGVGGTGWELTADVQAFLGTAQMTGGLDPTATVVATPAAGQVKGTDGPDWAVACVLLEVRATISTESRMGYGYCERLQWQAGRWMIAPGTPPAKAPSTWPGTDLSIQAGWRTWVPDEAAG